MIPSVGSILGYFLAFWVCVSLLFSYEILYRYRFSDHQTDKHFMGSCTLLQAILGSFGAILRYFSLFIVICLMFFIIFCTDILAITLIVKKTSKIYDMLSFPSGHFEVSLSSFWVCSPLSSEAQNIFMKFFVEFFGITLMITS